MAASGCRLNPKVLRLNSFSYLLKYHNMVKLPLCTRYYLRSAPSRSSRTSRLLQRHEVKNRTWRAIVSIKMRLRRLIPLRNAAYQRRQRRLREQQVTFSTATFSMTSSEWEQVCFTSFIFVFTPPRLCR